MRRSWQRKTLSVVLPLMVVSLFFVLQAAVTMAAEEKEVVLDVEGMTCNMCVEKVKAALEKVEGVTSADVSLEEDKAVVKGEEEKPSADALVKAVEEAGFKAKEKAKE